jgi:high-affinity nickel-transport protein
MMGAALVSPAAGVLALLGAALALGLRHGCEWHHLVAITDITGAAGSATAAGPDRARRPRVGVDSGAVGLATLYAVGHALVVLVLGAVALSSRALVPEWVAPATERLVGATLVALGAAMLWSLVRYRRGGTGLPVKNRLAVLADAARGLRRLWVALQRRLTGRACGTGYHVHPVGQYRRYGARAAFAVGVVHGLGAETGTQVLLIASVGGAADRALGAGLLLAFVAGMLLSNAALAFATSLGFLSGRHARTVYVVLAALTAAASLYVGACALLGLPNGLPELPALPPALAARAVT